LVTQSPNGSVRSGSGGVQEVEYSEEPGKLYYFKYHVAGGTSDDYLPVATTRPETVLGDTAVAVHPEDERYAKYVGKMAVVPLSEGRQIPIIADEVHRTGKNHHKTHL
jgi:valyl-tRNA synthetase